LESSPHEDRDLMRRLAGGDREAMAALFDRHASGVLGLLLRMTGQRAEAEELLQEVFFQAWQEAGRYRPEVSAPRSWLLMLARSRALDRLRSAGARRRREVEAARQARLDGHPVEAPRGYERLQQEERRRRVAAALGALPEEQRSAIELAFFEGLTHRQVAERLEAPLGTVKSRILLGMRKLRERLAG
jgi:RNA polymerase sigma-70 factor (ECF subfamily)